jgi:ATP-dependent exoDNAse (exonuclease V) beta subunit
MNGNSSHRAVEASAGTGKTTWITRQAVRLLAEQHARLDQLLLVTYTERATGDLKARLRAALEQARAETPDRRAPLQTALDGFDQAQVYTIHGFCMSILRDHPFETGFDFRPVLVNDKELLQSCLREAQRIDWPATYRDRLADVLNSIGYTTSGADRWEDLVQQLALTYRRTCGHCLKPQTSDADALGLAIETIHTIQSRVEAYKRERGLLSYEDMLTRVDDALDPKRNPRALLLRATLRARYRFGIVDEFQDTDPLQCRIFKRIFVEGRGPARLFVVGDPKQAIFGFRGADVQTYLDAVRELAAQPHAIAEQLDVNWRSCPELLATLNRLLCNGWFEGDIRYSPVRAAPQDKRAHDATADNSRRAALMLVDLRSEDVLKKARTAYARFVAWEIKRLLSAANGQPSLMIKKKDDPEPRPLRASDICILIFRRREAPPILQYLRAAKIPFSFYKQPGLWQSEEAEQFACLLHSLARPDEPSALRTALPTCFFRIQPEHLAALDGVPENSPAAALFRKWCALAAKRRWSELFQSLLEETGIVFDNPAHPRFERRLANFRQMFQVLEQAAYATGLDLVGLLEVLYERRQLAADEESNLQPIETERSKVRIMTVHAAKGDEYPVVFVAGGFTQAPSSNWFTYRLNNTERSLVLNLDKTDEQAKALHNAEVAAQERRLMYVTMTRAMFKLYVPCLKSRGYRGATGPLVKIVATAVESTDLERMGHPFIERILPTASFPTDLAADNVENSAPAESQSGRLIDELEEGSPVEPQPGEATHEIEKTSPVEPRLRDSPAQRVLGPAFTPGNSAGKELSEPRSRGFSLSRLEPENIMPEPSSPTPIALPGPLFPSIDTAALRQRFIRVRSYSALRKPHLLTANETAFADRPERDDDDEPDALDEPGLLRGTVFGDLVHDTLEAIDFQVVAAAPRADALLAPGPVRSLLEEVFDRHAGSLPPALGSGPDRESGLVQVARVVRNALHTPLKAVGARLCEIPKGDRLHELEFFFPELTPTAQAGQPEGFLMGFMDLVFRKSGAYYLLDWKTNDLHGDYSPEALRRCMGESDYERQYRLYAVALCRWLENRVPGFDFDKHFGGVYYLFVRGMNGQDESSGVFFRKPTYRELDLPWIIASRYPVEGSEAKPL